MAITEYVNMFHQRPSHESWRQQMAEKRPDIAAHRGEIAGKTPRAMVAPIASGNSVVASRDDVLDLLDKRNRKLKAIEMESGGVARAAHNRPLPVGFLAVKGISDFADERKKLLEEESKGEWRSYAARNASHLLAELLRDGELLDTQGMDGGTKFADARDRLTTLAVEFNVLRASMGSSRERTYELNRLLAPVRTLARGLPPSVYDVAGALADRADGDERIVAIIAARSLDNPVVVFDSMVNALKQSKSSFEQTHVLRYFEDIADALDREQRDRLKGAMNDMNVNDTSDRGLLRELVKRRMRGSALR